MKAGGGRAKGHAWERAVANLLKPLWPDARRGLDQPQDGGRQPDVDGTPFWVECKRGRRVNIHAAIEQALAARHGGYRCDPRDGGWLIAPRPVVVVSKDDRSWALATMPLDDWCALVEEWVALKRQASHLAAASDEVMCFKYTGDGR